MGTWVINFHGCLSPSKSFSLTYSPWYQTTCCVSQRVSTFWIYQQPSGCSEKKYNKLPLDEYFFCLETTRVLIGHFTYASYLHKNPLCGMFSNPIYRIDNPSPTVSNFITKPLITSAPDFYERDHEALQMMNVFTRTCYSVESALDNKRDRRMKTW